MVCSRYILVSLLIFPILINGKFLLFNGMSLSYQLNKSISVLRVINRMLIEHSVRKNSGDPDQTLRSGAAQFAYVQLKGR